MRVAARLGVDASLEMTLSAQVHRILGTIIRYGAQTIHKISDEVRLPAEFKHIIKRRKRN